MVYVDGGVSKTQLRFRFYKMKKLKKNVFLRAISEKKKNEFFDFVNEVN